MKCHLIACAAMVFARAYAQEAPPVVQVKASADTQRAVCFTETPLEHGVPPPTLGQHTDQVLREVLKKDAAEIARLRSEAVV